MLDPQQAAIAKEFDSYRDSYETAVNQAIGFSGLKVGFFVRAKANHLLDRLIRRFGTHDLSILDIGCGIGQYHPLLLGKVAHISGVDVSPEAIKKAQSSNPSVAYQTYGGETLPYADGQFDAVFTICVLHHVPTGQWEKFVSEMRRVLRSGGAAYLFEHNPRHPLTMRAVNDCPFDKDAVLVESSRAKELFGNAGFGDLQLQHILTIPATAGLPKKIDNLLSPIRFGAQYCLEAAAW